jgi:hypothetical protein
MPTGRQASRNDKKESLNLGNNNFITGDCTGIAYENQKQVVH